ncbi:MAG TPA: GlsB/YeaQ/YmgE family stress response membrane protein [Gaiellaceae bacterium]|nr:GlsB/YeaQ/YmgE family stress response membrane protein [Gaiellaceae bacterium]
MLLLIIGLALEGLVVGALARLALPGPDPMGIFATIGLGLGGSFVGGLITGLLWHRYAGFVFSVLGAILILYLYRRFVQHRTLTGPGSQLRR